jgi:lysophospholipid acyltransferase (LPLAT)-like uncharacterized protein
MVKPVLVGSGGGSRVRKSGGVRSSTSRSLGPGVAVPLWRRSIADDAHDPDQRKTTIVQLMPSPALVHALVRGLTKSLHIHRFGIDNVRQAMRQSPTGTVVFCHWHQSLLTILAPHYRVKAAVLASRSKDGEIISRYLEAIGIRAVRGSSSRGGAAGALELMRVLHEGYHIALTVDGPRGPNKQVKDGAIEIARRHGVPLIPVAARATREICFKRSWDHFRIPVPGSHLVLQYGAPIWLTGTQGDAEERMRNRRMLARTLHDLEAEASRRAFRSDLYPHPRYLAWLGKPADDHGPQDTA